MDETMGGEMVRPNWHAGVFFGLHYDLHANRDDTILGRDLTHEHLRAALETVGPDWVQCDCKGHPGYASYPTQVGIPAPGIVKDALRIHRDVTREMGIPLVVHYSGIWDDATMAAHPEWARVAADGRRDEGKACLTGPYTAAYMIPQMLEILERYDIDGFWVDGENWAARPCYCNRCRRLFADQHGGNAAPTEAGQPLWAEWLLFHRRAFEAHVRETAQAVHARKPACLVCSNWMYSMRQPDAVTAPVDYLSGDFEHSFGLERAAAEARFLDSRGLPWDLMAWTFLTGEQTLSGWTTKTLPHLCQEVAEVLACGGAVILYDTPQRSGHLVGWHHDLFAEVARFCRERQAVSQRTTSVPQVAVLHSSTSYYAHNDPLFNFGRATEPVEGALHALLDAGYHVDLVTDDTLLRRLERYPLVVIPEQEPLPASVAQALPAYVAGGGRLILSGASVADQLGELAGVTPAAPPSECFRYLPLAGGAVTVTGPWRPVSLAGARALVPLLTGQEPASDGAGTPAATMHEVGSGRVVAIHGPVFAAYYRTRYPRLRHLLTSLVEATWETPLVRVEAPGAVALTLRRQARRLLIHLLNRGSDPPLGPHRAMVERVPPQGPVTVRVRCAELRRVWTLPAEPQLVARWSEGVLAVTLPVLGIHTVLAFEDAGDDERAKE